MKVVNKSNIEKENKVRQMIVEKKIIEQFHHPFIVSLHSAFQTKSKLHFVMELCPGGELFYHLQKVGRMSESQSKFYFAEVVLGLEHMHSKNIVYRDLKPENILIDIDGHIRLADFGLSKSIERRNELTYSFCGSPEYMSPEMLFQKGHSFSVDFYALGALLFEMITGLPPHYSQNREEMYQKIKYSNLQMPNYFSPQLKSLLVGLLVKEPTKRLGCKRGIVEIKEHEWCSDIDWKLYSNKKATPPFKVNLRISNFDPECTNKSINNIEENQRHERSCSCYESSAVLSSCTELSLEDSFQQEECSKACNKVQLPKEKKTTTFLEVPSPTAQLVKGCNKLVLGCNQKFSYLDEKKFKDNTKKTNLVSNEVLTKYGSISPSKKDEIAKQKKKLNCTDENARPIKNNEISFDTKSNKVSSQPKISSIFKSNIKGKLQNLITPSYKCDPCQQFTYRESAKLLNKTSRESSNKDAINFTQIDTSILNNISNIHTGRDASRESNQKLTFAKERIDGKIKANYGFITPSNPMQNTRIINARNLASAREETHTCIASALNNATSRLAPSYLPSSYATNTQLESQRIANISNIHLYSKSAARNINKIISQPQYELNATNISQLTTKALSSMHQHRNVGEGKAGSCTSKHMNQHSSMMITKHPNKSILNNSIVNEAMSNKSSKKLQLQNIIRNAAIKQHKESMLKSAPLNSFVPTCKSSHDLNKQPINLTKRMDMTNILSQETRGYSDISNRKQNSSNSRIYNQEMNDEVITSRADQTNKSNFQFNGPIKLSMKNDVKKISHIQSSLASMKAKKSIIPTKKGRIGYSNENGVNI